MCELTNAGKTGTVLVYVMQDCIISYMQED
jgi:hypothetical protein